MRPDGQEGLTMDHTCRAVFILEEDHSIPAGHKPLMLEAILHRPITVSYTHLTLPTTERV